MLGLLCIAALVGNIFALLLFPDGAYLPASIAVLLACRLLGTGQGFLVAMVANSYTLIFSASPVASLLWVTEAWVVGMLLERGLKNLLLTDLLFWGLFGSLFRYLLDVYLLGMAWPAVMPTMLSQSLMATLNALLATLLYPLFKHYNLRNHGSLSFMEGELNILAGCFLIPPLLIVLVNAQAPRDFLLPSLESNLLRVGRHMEQELAKLEQDCSDQLSTLSGLPQKAAAQFEQKLKILEQRSPALAKLWIADSSGLPVACSNCLPPDKKMSRAVQGIIQPLYNNQKEPKKSKFFYLENGFGWQPSSLLMCVPLKKGQKTTRFALATLASKHLTEILHKAADNSGISIHLLGSDQRIIASNDEGLTAGSKLNRGHWPRVNSANLFGYLPGQQQLQPLTAKGGTASRTVPFQIILQTPDGSRQQHLQQMTLMSLAAMLLPAIPALFILYRLDRRVIIPLKSLAEMSENLPEKVLNREPLQWPTALSSECKSLCENLKESAVALQNSYQQRENLKEKSTVMLEDVLAQHRWENFTRHEKLKEERNRRERVEELIQNIETAESKYRFLIEKTMVGVFIVQDNRFTYVNPRFAEIFGYPEGEITEQLTLPDLIHPDDRFMVAAHNLSQLNGAPGNNLQYEFRGLKNTGELIHVEVLNGQSSRDGQPAIIGTLLDISKRKQAEETIQHLAFHDPLTELPNRILFADRIKQALHRAERNKEQVALLFIDLDRFKSVNDTLGHAAGDTILKEVASRLQNCLRQADTVSRFGGDEFNVLLTQISKEEEVKMIAHKILKALEWPYQVEGQEIFLSGSIGIALYPKDGQDAMSLTKNADTALYRAKDLGRNNYQPYSSAMNSRALERMALESSLRKVIDRQELRVYYQPQIDLQSGQVVGLEALMRWQHPTGRMIEPSLFIPLAEETGLIVPMGEWILRAACWQLKEWREVGLQPLRLGVNVSSKQFQQTNLTELVCSILQETGIEASQLNLEITESMIMSDVNESISVLQSLRDVGVTIAIDDFGTGFSSLSYLKDFPADHLKIDRAFVQNLPFSKSEANIARHIVELGHSLGLKVIAEGVERNDQMEFLKNLGCDEIQGYLFSPPLPAEEILPLIQKAHTFANLDEMLATLTPPQDLPSPGLDINQ